MAGLVELCPEELRLTVPEALTSVRGTGGAPVEIGGTTWRWAGPAREQGVDRCG